MALRNDLNAQVKADLTNFSSAIDGQAYILLGETVMGDSPVRFYYYDIASSATADGENVLAASAMPGGRFLKLNPEPLKRIETYLGNTNGSGNYTVTYSPQFDVTPDVQPQLQSGTSLQEARITASSETGFTVQVTQRTVVSLLGIDVITNSSTPITG